MESESKGQLQPKQPETPAQPPTVLNPPLSSGLTEVKEYSPTPHMLVWLNASMLLGTFDVSAISKNCKVSRQSWYAWLKMPGFSEWFYGQWHSNKNLLSMKLNMIGLEQAQQGKHNFWKDMQRIAGNLQDENNPLPVTTPVVVQNNNFTPKKYVDMVESEK